MKTHLAVAPLLLLGVLVLQSCRSAQPQACHPSEKPEFKEVSGVARLGDRLLMVGDDANGTVFSASVAGRALGIVALGSNSVEVLSVPHGTFAQDLEAIGIAGEVALVLSERLHCLVSFADGQFYEYPKSLSEIGNRGLEGLAIRPSGGGFKVAALWEGGFLQAEDLPDELRRLALKPLKPVLALHDLKFEGGRLVVENLELAVLKVPIPEHGYAFRAPDLEWVRSEEGAWQVAVLLSSENPNVPKSQPQLRWKHRQIRRFTLMGDPVPGLIDINAVVEPSQLKRANWEGLSWFEPGRTFVLVHDHPPKGIPCAYVIPAEWTKSD